MIKAVNLFDIVFTKLCPSSKMSSGLVRKSFAPARFASFRFQSVEFPVSIINGFSVRL